MSADTPLDEAEQGVVIFSSRESLEQIRKTVECCRAACQDKSSIIDLLINGNDTLPSLVKQSYEKSPVVGNVQLRVWKITEPDKAHTWNEYIHTIWPETHRTFFIDGYVEVRADAFQLLDQVLIDNPEARVASGVTCIGSTAEQLTKWQLEIRGIHGGLYSITHDAMDELREKSFRLPLGIYRSDPTVESVIKFDFDPASNEFNKYRVAVEPNATYWRRPLHWYRLRDLRTHFNRMLRQAQGDFEQAAVKQFLAADKINPSALPDTASELILGWMDRFPEKARQMVRKNPLRYFAARKVREHRDWSRSKVPPVLVYGENA